jgi:hypothetical protein
MEMMTDDKVITFMTSRNTAEWKDSSAEGTAVGALVVAPSIRLVPGSITAVAAN